MVNAQGRGKGEGQRTKAMCQEIAQELPLTSPLPLLWPLLSAKKPEKYHFKLGVMPAPTKLGFCSSGSRRKRDTKSLAKGKKYCWVALRGLGCDSKKNIPSCSVSPVDSLQVGPWNEGSLGEPGYRN